MDAKCLDLTKQAESVMKDEEPRRNEAAHSFTLKQDDYFKSRYTSLDNALLIERTQTCLTECQRPADILKRVLQ